MAEKKKERKKMDIATLSRYINYNFVVQAIMSALSGIKNPARALPLSWINHYVKIHKAKKTLSTFKSKDIFGKPKTLKKITLEMPAARNPYGGSPAGIKIQVNVLQSHINPRLYDCYTIVRQNGSPIKAFELGAKKPGEIEAYLHKSISPYLAPDPVMGSIKHMYIGALPVGLKFKLNGVLFVVGFQYQIDGKIVLDLQTESGSGQFDLTTKLGKDRAIAFLTGNANLRPDDRQNQKNAKQIIDEIAKEIKLANPAIKKGKPRFPGGEKAPAENTPEAIRVLHMQPGSKRNELIRKRNKPPVPEKKKPEVINTLTPGKPTKTKRMNARGFDVVEKRSITYTRKSPGKKIAGIGEVDPWKQYQRAPLYVKAIIDDLGDEPDYQDLQNAAIKLQAKGWYLDYGLDAGITELRRLKPGEKPYKIQGTKTKKPGKKAPSKKQLAARAKFAEMVRDRAAARKGKKVSGYAQRPEKIVSGINDRNWWAGFGKVPTKGKVNFILMPTERAAKKIEALTALSYVPRIKISITRGKQFEKLPIVRNSSDSAGAIKKFFTKDQLSTQEYGGAIFVDSGNRVLGCYIGFIGGIDSAVMDPRLVFGAALEVGAVGIILFHNHPSGTLRSSEADRRLTARFKKVAGEMQIQLMDHIIITNNGYFSLAENNEM